MDDEIAEADGSREPTEFKKAPRRAVASGWVGSALEYYDFFVYATAASLVFPDVFFPKGNPKLAIIESLATYGVGYAARPLGAFFLGRWGDKHGRKNVLVPCMLTMGCATFGVGLLPTYAAIGYLAPILLVVLRLIQGFAVGAELSGASAMIVENSPFGQARLLRQLHVAGHPGRPAHCRGSVPAAVLHPEHQRDGQLGVADSVPPEFDRGYRRLRHPQERRRDAGVQGRGYSRRGPEEPRLRGYPAELAEHGTRRLHSR